MNKINALKIALLGYGKMGRLVEAIALERGHLIVARVNTHNFAEQFSAVCEADVCIDFTHPDHIIERIDQLIRIGKNLVVGTTGWYDQSDRIKKLIEEHQTGLVYGPNFSIGVSLFLEVVSEAAALINHYPDYDVGGFESHHAHKADSPSGTAKMIAKVLLKEMKRKKKLTYELGNQPRKEDEIHFASLRCGSIPGTHTVTFDSESDSITLTHQARNRRGFAEGAIRAAEWIVAHKGMFTFEEMLVKLKH